MRSPWEQVKTARVTATASFFDPATFPMLLPPYPTQVRGYHP